MSLHCAVCGTELRVISMTAAGTSESCKCGATTMIRMTTGKLDLEPKPEAVHEPEPDSPR